MRGPLLSSGCSGRELLLPVALGHGAKLRLLSGLLKRVPALHVPARMETGSHGRRVLGLLGRHLPIHLRLCLCLRLRMCLCLLLLE